MNTNSTLKTPPPSILRTDTSPSPGEPLSSNSVGRARARETGPEIAPAQGSPNDKASFWTEQQVPDPRQSEMYSAAKRIEGILLPASFAGSGIVYGAEVSRLERPANNSWFQVHPSIHFDVLTFRGAQERTIYVANPGNSILLDYLTSRSSGRPTRCYPYAYNDGRIGFWPVLLDGTNGRALDDWNQSAHVIAGAAKTGWRAVIPGNRSFRAASAPETNSYDNPKWPADLAAEFLRTIEGVLVHDLEHPEMRRWRGLE
jgi:hypothetical protein